MKRVLSCLSLLLCLVGAAPALAQSLNGMGVVLLHGKQGSAGSGLGSLSGALSAEGAQVVTPEMPWSRSRMYDATYEQAMGEIDAAVAELKARGAKRIIVGGQSFGSNAALGYGARRSGLAAVLVIAMGHFPEGPVISAATAESRARAKALIASGQGNVPASFADVNQGSSFNVTATPKVYLNLFDPAGPASFAKNAGSVRAVPVFWAIGTEDPSYPRSRALYGRAAKNKQSVHREYSAGHTGTASAAASDIVAWLKGLK